MTDKLHVVPIGAGHADGRGIASVVGETAVIGHSTMIWNSAFVGPAARVGDRCTIGQGVHIGPKVIVGDGCKIQNGAQLFEGVTLEDDVFIGPHVVFTNVLTPRAHVSRRGEYKPTRVGRGASIGANATVLCGITIGSYAVVGAGSVVTRTVESHAIVIGNPARASGRWACRCGEALRQQREDWMNHLRCSRCNAKYTVSDRGITLEGQE